MIVIAIHILSIMIEKNNNVKTTNKRIRFIMTYLTNEDINKTNSFNKYLEYVEVDIHKNCHIRQRCRDYHTANHTKMAIHMKINGWDLMHRKMSYGN